MNNRQQDRWEDPGEVMARSQKGVPCFRNSEWTRLLLIPIALAVLIFCLASCSSGNSGPLRYDNSGRLSSDPEDIERAKQYLREGGKILRDPEAAAIQVSSICRASIGCTISMDGWENAAWSYCQRQYDHLPDTDRWAWHCVSEVVDYRDSLGSNQQPRSRNQNFPFKR